MTADVRTITPIPTDDEAAAIAAAVEVLWPEPVRAPRETRSLIWRYSGRWWHRDRFAHADRPW